MHSNGHVDLHTKKEGFVVDNKKCWLGVSPDAWVSDPLVDCNSDGIAEFKCPYTMANKTPKEMCNTKSFYLHFVNGIPRLKGITHTTTRSSYSFMLQDLLPNGVTFCVYSLKGVVVEQIFPDKHWQEECIPKLDKYFFGHILPELIDPQYKPSYYLFHITYITFLICLDHVYPQIRLLFVYHITYMSKSSKYEYSKVLQFKLMVVENYIKHNTKKILSAMSVNDTGMLLSKM